jgi:hypothetical protein
MRNIRLLAVLLILLSAKSAGYAFSINTVPLTLCNEITVLLSEDRIDLSTSHLTTISDNLNNCVSFASNIIPTGEDIRLLSKSKAYYISSRFLKPGLRLPDIIFPFHTFL